MQTNAIIAQTQKWILDVVIGCNFCPFAAREVKKDSVGYNVVAEAKPKIVLQKLAAAFNRLDSDSAVETLLLILPTGFGNFSTYLKLLNNANGLLRKNGYEGIYQLASFHPDYLFAGSYPADPANYTNRSPYPVIQILRESSVSKAVDSYPDIAKIPERNAAFATEKGLAFMKNLLSRSKE